MLKVNFDQLKSVQNTSGTQLSLKDRYECILDSYLHEPNNKANRESLKNNIETILLEAKENAIKEGKCYMIYDRKVQATDLNPVVFVEPSIIYPTRLSVSFNYDGEILLQDIYLSYN